MDENTNWHIIEYNMSYLPEDYDTSNLPADGGPILIYDAGSDEILIGYLWRGDNFRDWNRNGRFVSWGLPDALDGLYYKRWNPTHWTSLPQKPGR